MRNLFSGCALLAMAAAPGQVSAQNTVQAPAARTDGDIIVNARRRDEALSDVPAAVSALTAQDIAARPLERIEDFLRQTPSATIVYAGPEYLKDVSIRGQGGGRNGFSDSATGVYRNGIYVAGGGFGGRSLNPLDLFDLQSFEVYRGPQGALYGRNAVGGAVNVITRQPQRDMSAEVEFGFDGRDRFGQSALANLPVGDFAAVRVGVIHFDQNGGFIRDRATGRYVDFTSFSGFRAAARVFDIGGFSLTGTYERSETDAPGFSPLGARTFVATRPTAIIDPDRDLRNSSRYGRTSIIEDSLYANLDGSLGFANVAAVFTHRIRNARRGNEDLDHFLGFEGIGGSDLTVAQTERFRRSGAELRLTSPQGATIPWLLGIDWQNYRDDVSTINDGVTTVATLRELATRSDLSTERYTSYSAFGSVDLPVARGLTFSAEARVQRDEKSFDFVRIDRMPAPTNTSIPPITTVQAETRFSPGASVKWEFADRAQAYLRFASAFRPAGFNIGTGVVAAIPYRSEVGRGLELGVKAPLFAGLRVALSGYYLWLDRPQIVTTVSATDTTVVLQNISSAKYSGLELELIGNWRLGGGRLSVSASASTQRGSFGPNSQVTVNGVVYDVSNTRANRVRDFIGNFTTTYDFALGGEWSGFATFSATGELGGFENAVGALNVAGVSRTLADYALLHAKLGLRYRGATLSAFINNIADRRFITQNVQGNNYFNEGRVIGVTLRAGFGPGTGAGR